MKRAFMVAALAALTTTVFTACKKDNDSGSGGGGGGNSRKIKYEITGNFSGKLDVVYSDNVNGTTQVSNVAVPWSKEIQYSSNVMTVGIGAQASVVGSPGQTATIKIYSNGNVVKTSAATAGSSGEIIIPTTAYGF
jgi:hypothetical protein